MKIMILLIADGDYVLGANIVIDTFKKNITNPEGHQIEYVISSPNHDYDYLHFYNDSHKGRKISLSRFKYFDSIRDFDRIIYIDSDMEIVGNVDLLISEELNSKPYWACHVNGYTNYYGAKMKEFGLENKDVINGGLQIINKELLSSDFHDKLIEFLVPGESFDGSDQGYLSVALPMLNIEIGWLPEIYNYCLQDAYRTRDLKDVRINHYTGTKLWEI